MHAVESAAQTPVFIERPGHYLPHYSGGCVGYLDGNVEYIDYPGKFPMTKEFIEMLETLDKVGNYWRDQ
jgi:hypothetical protein